MRNKRIILLIMFLMLFSCFTGLLIGYAIPSTTEEPVTVQINEPESEPEIEPDHEIVDEPEEQFIIPVTDAEIDLLSRLVSAEAKGESFEGMIAVANVVLNRLNSPKWKAETIHEVIFQPRQFQPVDNGAIYQEPTDEAVQATIEALKGTTVIADDVDCFAHHTIDFSSWANYNVSFGNHHFWVLR